MTVSDLNDPWKIDFRHFWFLDSLRFMQISRKLLGRRHLLKFIKEKGNLVRMADIYTYMYIFVDGSVDFRPGIANVKYSSLSEVCLESFSIRVLGRSGA
jgi:hypothetical protein